MANYRWFDTKGLANIAKNALKEAQKQIDKALDIQDDETNATIGDSSTTTATTVKKAITAGSGVGADLKSGGKSKTEPNTPISDQQANLNASNWGSFTGSFFDNPNANEMVTTPPKATSLAEVASASSLLSVKAEAKRQSVTSLNSDSVEVLSPPTTSSCSEIPSESVEVITTPTSVTDVDSVASASMQSIVIIGSNEISNEEEEEDSISYTTVMDDTLTPSTVDVIVNQEGHAGTNEIQPTASLNETDSNTQLLISLEDIPLSESQTVDSDSTQSFEEIQMQSSTISSTKGSTGLGGAQRYNSSHNSNDEIETTTTSSDIEIISNPNGDSSSNSTTRTSPQKQKKSMSSQIGSTNSGSVTKKGHYREPSEVSILSEDSQSELEKLMLRISELSQTLEQRNLRLVQLEHQNVALQERSNELQIQVDAMRSNDANLDSAEQYTQRLSALEKKFQASIRERDALRNEIKALKDDLLHKIPKDDLAQVVTEKNQVIDELRLEGEKLSKEILQQSNIIKKLRAKEKTSDALIKKNKDEIATLMDENAKLKKTLSAKEEVERTQIEAVHKMSSEKRKLSDESDQLRSKIEDLQTKLATLQASFDAVKTELQQRSRLQTDLTRTAETALAVKKEKEHMKAENEELSQQLHELREKLRSYESTTVKREQQLREENRELLKRLEAAELRAESSTQEISLTTIPLMRQLESLQNTLSQRQTNWNKEEKVLLEKLAKSESKLNALENIEATYKDKLDLLQARCLELEDKLSHSLMQEEKLKLSLQQSQLDYNLKESNLNKKLASLKEELNECKQQIQSLEEAKKDLEQQSAQLKAEHSASNYMQQESMEDCTELARLSESQQRPSPPTSFGRNSLEEAMGAKCDWQEMDDLDCISNSGRNTLPLGMHLSFMGHSTSTLEHLQSLLKQRDGELTHLQWELSRAQAERGVLGEEISTLTLELENIKERLQSYENLEKTFAELQDRYDALLQMYGEKVERVEELQLDLIELKEAYKVQIDELLAQPRKTT